jgi:hypothetical protein
MGNIFAAEDFITQKALEDLDVKFPEDQLEHDKFSKSLLSRLSLLPAGSVVALQGSWGRGKTDVLARLAKMTYGDTPTPGIARKAIWLNPWEYGTSDLLTPLVLAVLQRIPPPVLKVNKKALFIAAKSVIRAGVAFGFKASSILVPGGTLLAAAADPVDRLLDGLFAAKEKEAEETDDIDPISSMAKRFRELVDALLKDNANDADARLLVCIDDLDRCMPDTQVAMLEALRFLVSAHARVTLLVAIDTTLVRQSVLAHYKSESFDADSYLDKLFSVRLSLPAMAQPKVENLIRGWMDAECGPKGKVSEIVGAKFNGYGGVPSLLSRALILPEIRSPRIVRRILQKITLIADADSLHIRNEADAILFFRWLAICERWPQVRIALQDAGGEFPKRFRELHDYHTMYNQGKLSGSERIPSVHFSNTPTRQESEGFHSLLSNLKSFSSSQASVENDVGIRFYDFDKALMDAGL